MWRFWALFMELITFLYSVRLVLSCENKLEWASKRTFFALESGEKLGAIEWLNKK